MSEHDKVSLTDEVTIEHTKAPQKKPAKKAAARKAAEPREAWPYADDEYVYADVVSPRGKSDPEVVAKVQEALGINADGDWAEGTSRAVLEYQRQHDLEATGVVDRSTWNALFS